MTKLTMYIDGSEFVHESGLRSAWGVLALHSDLTSVELRGRRQSLPKHHRGFYEILALYKAIQHAESCNLQPHEVSFYTDCDWCAYGGFHLHPGNYSATKEKVLARIKEFRAMYYPGNSHVIPTLVKWLVHARFHWVKGHAQHVGNCRADHLARVACLDEEYQDYDEWILEGFEKWDPVANQMTRVKPAFTEMNS